MNMVDILIKNGIVVTMDSQRRIIDGGSLAVEKDKIIDIGPTAELEEKYSAKQVIDAANMVVFPGLINCHAHSGLSLLRGVGDDLSLFDAHQKVFGPLVWGPAVQPQDVYIGTLLSCIDFIKSGQTCTLDHYVQSREVATAFESAGLRALVAPFMEDTWLGPGEVPIRLRDRKEVIDDVIDFIKAWNGKADGRIRCAFGPTHELFASKELLVDVVRLAKEYDVDIHMLLAETTTEVDTIIRLYGKRSIEYVYDLGLLGPRTTIGHGVWLSPNDIALLARSGASVAPTPVCEMKISDGIGPVPSLLKAGVNVALGTDAAGQCTGSNDLIREMKTLALLHKVNYPLDPEVITAETVLEMVTVNGAKALRWDNEIGSLEKGKKADIILLDLKKSHLTPTLREPKLNVVSLLVYSAVGGDIDTMIVNGKTIMLHQRILTLDEAKIMGEAQQAAERLIERSGVAKDKGTFPWKWSI